MSEQPKSKDLKIVVAGICVKGDCDCRKHDQELATGTHSSPPFHDGCTCYMVERGPAPTQPALLPKPGRTLDEAMAKVMGWALPEQFDMQPEYPYVQTIKALGLEKTWKFEDCYTAREWNPSTNIAHAFEVQRDGWRWEFVEGEASIKAYLSWPRSENWKSVAIGIVAWENGTTTPAAYALARCRAVAAWWETQE